MKKIVVFVLMIPFFGCKNNAPKTEDNLSDISEKAFRTFKVEDSNYIDLTTLWAPFQDQLSAFSEEKYNALKPLIMNQDIPTLQRHTWGLSRGNSKSLLMHRQRYGLLKVGKIKYLVDLPILLG